MVSDVQAGSEFKSGFIRGKRQNDHLCVKGQAAWILCIVYATAHRQGWFFMNEMALICSCMNVRMSM